jgi:hypothetical protein
MSRGFRLHSIPYSKSFILLVHIRTCNVQSQVPLLTSHSHLLLAAFSILHHATDPPSVARHTSSTSPRRRHRTTPHRCRSRAVSSKCEHRLRGICSATRWPRCISTVRPRRRCRVRRNRIATPRHQRTSTISSRRDRTPRRHRCISSSRRHRLRGICSATRRPTIRPSRRRTLQSDVDNCPWRTPT